MGDKDVEEKNDYIDNEMITMMDIMPIMEMKMMMQMNLIAMSMKKMVITVNYIWRYIFYSPLTLADDVLGGDSNTDIIGP